MKICETCRFWDSTKGLQKPKVVDEFHCQCLVACMLSYGGAKDQCDKPMIVMDGSQYMAVLYTRFDHFCSSWGEKTNVHRSGEIM